MPSPPVIIADASPLIGLAKIGRLALLRALYREILIPPAVHAELRAGGESPGSPELRKALDEKWISVAHPTPLNPALVQELEQTLDAGEAQAIALALSIPEHLLIIDERLGRIIAQRKGVRITGTGAVLLAAKAQGYIPSVAHDLQALHHAGYRLSARLRMELMAMAGETQ